MISCSETRLLGHLVGLLHNMYKIKTTNIHNLMKERLYQMTLLLNDRVHPKVYKKKLSKKNIPNQTLYRINYMNEFINQQRNVNNHMTESIEQSNLLFEDSRETQNRHFETLLARSDNQEILVNQFIDKIRKQETPIQMIMERLDNLEKLNKGLIDNIEKDGVMNEAIMAQLSFQDQSSHAISKALGGNEVMVQELIDQQRKQEGLFEEISKKLMIQESFHQTIMEQLEQQKAITQKLSNKLDNLKEVITEKVASFTDKLEENYRLTTSFVSSFLERRGVINKSPTMLSEKEEVMK